MCERVCSKTALSQLRQFLTEFVVTGRAGGRRCCVQNVQLIVTELQLLGGVSEFLAEVSPRLCLTMCGVDSRTRFANQRAASCCSLVMQTFVLTVRCRGECCDVCVVDCGVSAQWYSVDNDVISYEIRCHAKVGVQACGEFDTIVLAVGCL
jgi:hypothetical protein